MIDRNSSLYKNCILPSVIKKHNNLNEIRKNMSQEKIDFLESANTKHLLGLLRRLRESGEGTHYYWDGSSYSIPAHTIDVKYYKKGGICIEIELSSDEIRTELRNRPDFTGTRNDTNRNRRKLLRQQKAWEARRNKSKN